MIYENYIICDDLCFAKVKLINITFANRIVYVIRGYNLYGCIDPPKRNLGLSLVGAV